MKCDDCVNLLEAYVDGEVGEQQAESVRTHLMTCSACENEFELLTAEADLYARYDRELPISPAVWNGIAAQIATQPSAAAMRERRDLRRWFAGLFAAARLGFAFSGALAVLLAMVAVGYFYFRTGQSDQRLLVASSARVKPDTSKIDSPVEPPLPNNGGQSTVVNPEGPESTTLAQQKQPKRPRAIP